MTQVPLSRVPEVLGMAFADADPWHLVRVQEQANVEALTRMIHAIAGGRFGELRADLASDVAFELVAPARFPFVRRAAGADEVAAAVAANFAAVRDQLPEPLSLVAQGDTVMLMARETGRLAHSGEEYAVLAAQQFTFCDGKLAAFRSVVGELADPSA